MPDIVVIPQQPEDGSPVGKARINCIAVEGDTGFIIGFAVDLDLTDTVADMNQAILDRAVLEYSNISVTIGPGDRKLLLGGIS